MLNRCTRGNRNIHMSENKKKNKLWWVRRKNVWDTTFAADKARFETCEKYAYAQTHTLSLTSLIYRYNTNIVVPMQTLSTCELRTDWIGGMRLHTEHDDGRLFEVRTRAHTQSDLFTLPHTHTQMEHTINGALWIGVYSNKIYNIRAYPLHFSRPTVGKSWRKISFFFLLLFKCKHFGIPILSIAFEFMVMVSLAKCTNGFSHHDGTFRSLAQSLTLLK